MQARLVTGHLASTSGHVCPRMPNVHGHRGGAWLHMACCATPRATSTGSPHSTPSLTPGMSGPPALSTLPPGTPSTSGGGTIGTNAQQRDNTTALFERQVEGKSFMCTQCGKCCTGSGEVWVNAEEAQRIADHLKLSVQGFIDVYCKSYNKYKGWRMLRSRPGSEDCIFLDGKLCSIHDARPSQCSTYPWWPELMSPEGWGREKTEICEGFDHPDAPPLDKAAAAAQLKQASRDLQMRMLSRSLVD